MKKILKLALVVFLLVAFKNSWAVGQATAANTTAAVPLATVNIQEAKIVSQNGNNFKISFFLTNRESYQSGVKYSVRLYTKDDKKQLDLVVSEKVYDEELKLSPNARVKKEIEYTAPDVLDGEYHIALLSYNVQGFPLAFFDLEKVKVTRTLKGVEILNDSCAVKVNNEKSDVAIDRNLLIKPEDSIYLNCSAINHDSKQVTVTPIFETRLGSAYGEVVSPTGGDNNGIVFKALEKKDFSVLIPTKSIDPQAYDLSFFLKGSDSNSNQVKFNYKIDGVSAVLYNVSLDNSHYKKGDTAKVTALLRVNKTDINTKYYLNVNIINDKNVRCGQQFTKEIDNSFISNFDIKINNNCNKSKVVANITDSNGKILSQFGNAEIKSPLSSNILKYTIVILVLIILAVLIAFIMKNKKGKINKDGVKQDTSNTGTITPLVLLIAASLFANFLFINKASADTFCLTELNSCDVLITVSSDKSNYLPGDTITTGGIMASSLYSTAYLYGWLRPLQRYLRVTQNSTTKNIIDVTTDLQTSSNYFMNNPYASTTFTAPSSVGSYSLSFTSGVGCNANYRFATIPDGTDGGCSTPNITETSNMGIPSDTATPRYRKQQFTIHFDVKPGDVFNVIIYSRVISVTAVAGDTPSSIVSKLASAINNTTVAQWQEAGDLSYLKIGTTSYGTYFFNGQTKPYVPRPNSDSVAFDLYLDWQHQAAHSVSPADSTGDWKYATYNLGYSVTLPPTISIRSSAPSVNSGGYVDIIWEGSNLDHCSITATDLVTSSVADITYGDMRTSGNYQAGPLYHNTKFTANCSNVPSSCKGISSSNNLVCSQWYDDENCIRYGEPSKICTWN